MQLQHTHHQSQQHAWYALRRVVGLCLLAVAVLAGTGSGVVLFFAAATLTSTVLAMTLAALLGCLVLTSGIAWLAFRALTTPWSGRAALATGATTTLMLAALAALTIFKPLAAPQTLSPLPRGATYWDLPTGSHLAVLHVPAQGVPKATPLILVHGGPGAFEVTAAGAMYYGTLARDGFDVYLYDQIGSGHSARLLQRNVQAAYHFVPEAELDGFGDAIIASFLDGALCGPHSQAREDLSAGFGFWSMTMTNWHMSERRFDAHAVLSTNTTPALILHGECDYIPLAVAAAYKNTLPDATLVAVPRAGHLIYYEQPEWYLAAVRAFLLEQPLPLTPGTNSAPPLVEDSQWSSQDQ